MNDQGICLFLKFRNNGLYHLNKDFILSKVNLKGFILVSDSNFFLDKMIFYAWILGATTRRVVSHLLMVT